MIAYNKIWLTSLRLQNDVKENQNRGYITAEEFKNIKDKYPVGFYTPGLFARIGLFILTIIVVTFADGILSLLFASASNLFDTAGWVFFLSILSYTALEVIVSSKHHYRSGVDDALLFISALLSGVASAMLFSHYNVVYYMPVSATIFILSLYFTIRFADMLMAALCGAALFAFIYFGWTKLVPFGIATIPFVIMLVSAGLYWGSYNLNRQKQFAGYYNCILIAQIIFLLGLYTAGNYYVVQTLGDNISDQAGKPIPLGTFFWLWTMLIPLVYLGWGIFKKNTVLLRMGLVLIAAAIATFRYYYHVLPLDMVLTMGGALILGIAYTAMRYLKTPKHGFTYAEPDTGHMMDHLKVESLIVAETFAKVPSPPAEERSRFGGGDFGGGGSSSSY
ncbi:hypothetical protein [Mucilaginibacter sp. BT774]|uniref:hypothetical protein n=1 Tax=Mucilaginibacter sp. BT774 TaxID=3062276 RepID=UPI0026755774|nr:hypothetical protein [Mucilaginibacter sp. BT774]MDO3625811.1 hypothetical protein [Mucilaginibacter sp. BT774]